MRRDLGRKELSVAGKGPSHTCKEKNTTIKNTNTEQLNSLKMHSFSLLSTITRVTTVEEKYISLLWEKGNQPHTCKEKNTTIKKQLKNDIIVKLTQNAFFFTLTHYNAGHDPGRKMHRFVT